MNGETKTLPRGLRIDGKNYVAFLTPKDGLGCERRVIGLTREWSAARAEKQLRDWQSQIRLRTYTRSERSERKHAKPAPKPAPEKVTCASIWKKYLADAETNGKRTDRMEQAWAHLEPEFGNMAAVSVEPLALFDYRIKRLADGAANATANRELSMLQASLRFAARLQVIPSVPLFPKKLKEAKPKEGFVEEEQYKTLAANCDELWLRAFLAIGFYFAWRKGEILGLRVRDVDFLGGVLHLRDSKNGTSRKVVLIPEVQTLLLECVRGKSPEAFLLTHADGSNVVQPRKNWYSLCARCGLGEFTKGRYRGLQMHDLRRSGVRRMVRRGVSEKVAMTISGHKTRSVFDRYDIGSERDLENAAKLIGGQNVAKPPVETDTKTDSMRFGAS